MNNFFGDKFDTMTPAEILTYIGIVCGAILLVGNQYSANRRNIIIGKGNLDTRFKDAALLLAHENTSANISGIYALHQIAIEASKGDSDQQGYIKTFRIFSVHLFGKIGQSPKMKMRKLRTNLLLFYKL